MSELTKKLAGFTVMGLTGLALASIDADKVMDITPRACIERNSGRPAGLFYNTGVLFVYGAIAGAVYHGLKGKDE